MKKFFCLLLLFLLMMPVVSETYRYLIVKEEAGGRGSVGIMDLAEKLSEQVMNENGAIPINTAQERYIAESGLRNIEDFYWRGLVSMVYVDATTDDGDIQFISSWYELLQYVRGEK